MAAASVVGDLHLLFCILNRSRKEEIKALTANDFSEFYSRVKSIKDFHRKHPNEVVGCFMHFSHCSFEAIMFFLKYSF